MRTVKKDTEMVIIIHLLVRSEICRMSSLHYPIPSTHILTLRYPPHHKRPFLSSKTLHYLLISTQFRLPFNYTSYITYIFMENYYNISNSSSPFIADVRCMSFTSHIQAEWVIPLCSQGSKTTAHHLLHANKFLVFVLFSFLG